MIRATKNETISVGAKQRHAGGAVFFNVFPRSQLYETVDDTLGTIVEKQDAFDLHTATFSVFPGNAFNGTFEGP